MLRYLKLLVVLIIGVSIIQCNKKESVQNEETINTGQTTAITDATLTPIIEDQIAVYESSYNAKIKLISKSESEVINALIKDSIDIAILSRNLTSTELNFFGTKRKLTPKVTPFATDALAFIRNNRDKDTLINLSDVLDFMKGKPVRNIRGLVFDNPNSSTIRYIKELAGLDVVPKNGIYSFGSNQEAIKYIADNQGIIGVVGLNWLSDPSPEMQVFIDKITVLSVKGLKDNFYYSPTQNNIAEGKYPLARDLFIVNCQGFAGLGTGLATFITGERGQRIILKSGLLPIRMPGRKVVIRTKINK